jgi:hypothetical protein
LLYDNSYSFFHRICWRSRWLGLAWAFALNAALTNGLYYGGIAGFALGLFFLFISKGVVSRGNVQKKEAVFMTGSFLGLLLLGGIGTAIIAWLIRLIF